MQRYIVQTIYRVDIGHIVPYRYRQKNIEISIYRCRFDIVSISAKRRRCCLFIFLFVGNKSIKLWVFLLQYAILYSLYIHQTERRLRPFSLSSYVAQTSNL